MIPLLVLCCLGLCFLSTALGFWWCWSCTETGVKRGWNRHLYKYAVATYVTAIPCFALAWYLWGWRLAIAAYLCWQLVQFANDGITWGWSAKQRLLDPWGPTFLSTRDCALLYLGLLMVMVLLLSAW